MKIGVRVHDFGKSNAKTLAKQAREIGFDGVQLVINKALEGESGLKGTISEEKIKNIKESFDEENVKIMMLGSYFNPVHSDKTKVQTFIDKFKDHLSFALKLDCHYVGSETGSFNDDKWTYNPLNRTENAYQEVKTIFKDILETAKKEKVNVALEGAYGHCMYEPKVLKRLFDEINNGYLSIIVDIYNYLYIGNYQNHVEILKECLELFKKNIVIIHVKDFIVENDKLTQVAIGKGIMRWDIMLPLIHSVCPDAYLVFEGSKKEDMRESFMFIKNILKEIEK